MPTDYESMLPGFQYAESRGERDPWSAVGDQGASRGAFQIQPIMYQDIQQHYPKEWSKVKYEQMLASPESQRAAILTGLRMLENDYGLQGDFLISGWNTGPTKARKGILNKAYVDTVKKGIELHRRKQGSILNRIGVK